MDFTQEELLEAVERLVYGLLERAGVITPPIDALQIAEDHLGIPVEVIEPVEEDDNGRRRPRGRPQRAGIFLTSDMSREQRQKAAADGIARSLMPVVLTRLGVAPENETRPFVNHVRGLIIPRILIPTCLLRAALRECKYDLPALKAIFATASIEMIALRLLDLDEPSVITIIDDGIVAVRRSNRFPVSKKLESVEHDCHERIVELQLPHRVRRAEWTVQGWLIADRAFQRIILRSVRDEDI